MVHSITSENIDEMIEMRELGDSLQVIAKHFGVSRHAATCYMYPEARNESRRASKQYRIAHPNYKHDVCLKAKIAVINLLGGKCFKCGTADTRVLVVNHKDGGGRRDCKEYSDIAGSFYTAILKGLRRTDDLNLLCVNCNILYEYSMGRRREDGPITRKHNSIISLLGGKCCSCGITDLRILEVNHISGGGNIEYKEDSHWQRKILTGERDISDLNVLCGNCNMIHRHELESQKRIPVIVPFSFSELKARLKGRVVI